MLRLIATEWLPTKLKPKPGLLPTLLLLANYLQLFYFLIFCLFLFQSQSFHLTLICFFLQSSCSCLDIYSHLRLIILLILLLNLLLLLCILNRLFCNFCRSRLVLKRVSIKALTFLQTLCFLLCLCRTCTFNIWFSLRLWLVMNWGFWNNCLLLLWTWTTHFEFLFL